MIRYSIVLASMGTVAFAACRAEPSTPVVDEALQALEADAVVYGMDDYMTQDGVRTGQIIADSAYVYDSSNENRLFGVQMTLFDSIGRARARLRADSGVLNQMTEQMTARGNVVLNVLDRGYVVESAELHYRPGPPETIRSDSLTTFTRGTTIDRGTCFEADLQFRNWSVCDPRPVGGGSDR